MKPPGIEITEQKFTQIQKNKYNRNKNMLYNQFNMNTYLIVTGKHPKLSVYDASDQDLNQFDNWLGLIILLIFINFSEKVKCGKSNIYKFLA